MRVALSAFEATCGPDATAVVFGIPGFAHQLLGRKDGAPDHALGYEMLRAEMALCLDAAGFEGALGYLPDLGGGEAPWDADALVALAARTTAAHHGSTLRDARQLSWRYRERPGAQYSLFAVPGEQGLRGAAIVRTDSPHLGGSTAIAEWWVEDHDYDGGLALLRAILTSLRQAGTLRLVAPFADTQPWWHHLQWHGFLVHPIPEVSLARTFRRAHDIGWCRTAWAPSPGDLDLV